MATDDTTVLSGTAYQNFTYIRIHNFAYASGSSDYMASAVKIDDIILFSSSASQEEPCPVTGYNYIGTNFFTGATSPTTKQYAEAGYFVKMNAITIKAFDYFVASNYGYDLTFGETYISGYINEQPIGKPDCFYQNPDWNYASYYRWTDLNIELNDEEPFFELRSTGEIDSENGFKWVHAVYYGDGDGDGYITKFTHNSGVMYGDGYNGIDDSGQYSLCFRFWYENDPYTPENTFDDFQLQDTLDFHGDSYAGYHLQYDLKSFYAPQPVNIIYSLESLTAPSIMNVYYEGSKTGTTQGFSPMYLDDTKYSGVVAFTPLLEGNYTVQINRSGSQVVNASFYAFGIQNTDYYLYSIPAITTVGNPYKIYYHYNSTNDGYVALFFRKNNMDYSNAIYTHFIGSGTDKEGSFDAPTSFEYDSEGSQFTDAMRNPHYWVIFSKTSSNAYVRVSDIHKHLIRVGENVETFLSVLYKKTVLNDEGYATQYFRWGHNYLGADIWVFDNGQKLIYAGDIQATDYTGIKQLYYTNGLHTVELRVRLNGSWYAINDTRVDFEVTGGVDLPQEGSGDEIKGFFSYLTHEQRFLVGIGIIGVFAFLPFYLSYEYNTRTKNPIAPPKELYTIMATLGFAVGIYFQLFGLYTIVIMVFIIVSIIVIQMLIRFGGGGGSPDIGGE